MSNNISQSGSGAQQAAIGNNNEQNIQESSHKEEKKTLAEAAREIQELLEQLSQTYPTSTPLEQMTVVTEAVKEIESQPSLKARVISALQAGGIEAFKEAVDHPLVNIFMAAIEGWQEPKQ